MKIGILTGGGDAPGLNAVIRSVTIAAEKENWKVIGIKNGWAGLMNADAKELTITDVRDILTQGGTILGSSRTNPYKTSKGPKKAMQGFRKLGLDSLIAIGGEDTLGVANKLYKEFNAKIVGIPKTIDGDLSATDYTIGFNSGVSIATEAIDRVHTTMRSHGRCGVIEIMGRHAGWMTLVSGTAGGAHVILIPEEPFDIDEVCMFVNKAKKRYGYAIVAVAEGALPKNIKNFITKDKELDEFGHVKLGGIANILAKEIEKRTKIETRAIVLGHIQRGGSPTVIDRVLGVRFGLNAIKLIKTKQFGKMVSLTGNKISEVWIEKAVGKLRVVPKERYAELKNFFGN
jgi:6-phosphofructokinase 1